MPYLHLVKTYAPNQYRILYSVAEAGVYYVAFYCDIQVQFDETSQTLHVTSLAGIPPVPPKATFNSVSGQGYYTSRSVFHAAGAQTNVAYDVDIQAQVPKRLAVSYTHLIRSSKRARASSWRCGGGWRPIRPA